jgi:hypothetical protein
LNGAQHGPVPIVSWIRRLFHRRPSDDELLNEGLELAMDWGENWLSPINARLRKLHPHLRAEELEACNAACQGAMRLGCEAVHTLLRDGSASPSAGRLATIVRARYPWVNEDNLGRLLQQGVYYAAKVGGHGREA